MKKNNKDYILMPQMNTYALGVEALRESYSKGKCPLQPLYTKADGSKIVRPLTCRENIEEMVDNYNTLNHADGSAKTYDERLILFDEWWINSCTGIAYKAGTTKFKIVPQSQNLIEIPFGFREGFLPVDYGSIDGIELDSSKGKYNKWLNLSEVKSHPAWLAAVEDNNALLSEYANIIFAQKYQGRAMDFWVWQNTEKDELRALFVDNFDCNSFANCLNDINGFGSFFLRGLPQKISTGNKGKKQ